MLDLGDHAARHDLRIGDHLLMAGGGEDQYPSPLPVTLDFDQLEPLTLFAAIAAVTKSARLITGILLGPLRPAKCVIRTLACMLDMWTSSMKNDLSWHCKTFKDGKSS